MAKVTAPSVNDRLRQAREGVFEAIFFLCQDRRPQSFTELVRIVYPTGGLDKRLFDALDKAYSCWLGEGAPV